MKDPTQALLIPMIGTAPLEEIAESMDLPTHFPWLSRPADYGQGVEGKLGWDKFQMVSKALQVKPESFPQIKDKDILIVDDNLTDGATYVLARQKLLEAGARSVSLAVLIHTVRRREELSWLS